DSGVAVTREVAVKRLVVDGSEVALAIRVVLDDRRDRVLGSVHRHPDASGEPITVGEPNPQVLDLPDGAPQRLQDPHEVSGLESPAGGKAGTRRGRMFGVNAHAEGKAGGGSTPAEWAATKGTRAQLPAEGSDRARLRERMETAAAGDADWLGRMAAGTNYPAGDDVLEGAKEAYLRFFQTNGLLPDLFPSLAPFQHH